MSVIDLQGSKIILGDTDYPAKHNAMIDEIERAINAVQEWDNAARLNGVSAEVREYADRARSSLLMAMGLIQEAAASAIAAQAAQMAAENAATAAGAIQDASTTVRGIIEIATLTEANDGDTSRAVTGAIVQSMINALIDGAPGALNTLDELAASLGDDANYAATITTALAAKLSGITGGTGITVSGSGTTRSVKVTDGGISSTQLAAAAVTLAKLANGAVSAVKLATNAVETAKIKNSAVTTAKINNDAVTNIKIADDAVDTAQIADDAVETAQIADNAITKSQLASNAVETAKIKNSAVTTAKINNDAVTNIKIADDAVDTAQIADDAVETAQIADNAITKSQLASNAVETAKIKDDAVTNAKLADNAVGQSQIADNAVIGRKINNNSIGTSKIANNAVTLAKMAGGTAGKVIGYNSSGDPAEITVSTIKRIQQISASPTTSQRTNTDVSITSVIVAKTVVIPNSGGAAGVINVFLHNSTTVRFDGNRASAPFYCTVVEFN